MEKIVFASSNPHKIAEVRSMIGDQYEILGLKDINCLEEVPETQETIEGNACQKAQYIYDNYGYECFADDSGLEITSLDGRPGVHSAMYGGPERSHEKNNARVLSELSDKSDRSARFKTVIAFIKKGEITTFTGVTSGQILEAPLGKGGFGYDPIFQPEGFTQSFGQIDADIKNSISSRARAVNAFVNYLKALPVE